MLMSDTWQPSVLQLLPFSTNDACNPRPPSSPRLRALPTPDHSRGFPVLAVTRRGRDAGGVMTGSGGFPPSKLPPQHRSAPTRASSERLPRALTQNDSPASTARAKSEYNSRRGNNTASRGQGTTGGTTRDPTCSITDINERIMSRMNLRAGSSSPDSGAGSHGNSPFASATPEAFGNTTPGLPKPAFLPDGLPANGVTTGTGMTNGAGNEGRYAVSGKNGLWRSVTLTPGEMELRKHRVQLDRAQGTRPGGGEGRSPGRRYKLNVKDLPRSSTPVNDHDPDKLNMKQVIAFLQSKGKSQADAIQLPSDQTAKTNPGFRRASKSGVMRGRHAHRIVNSSSAAEIAARLNGWDGGGGELSPRASSTAVRMRDMAENGRVTTSMPSARTADENPRRWTARDGSEDGPDPNADASPRKPQRPFRLHRFVTIMPEQKEPSLVTTKSHEVLNTSPPQPARVESHVTRSALHERTECSDLAAQSKSQTNMSSGMKSSELGGLKQLAPGEQRALDSKVQYRIPTQRLSSLRVEQDEDESEWKPSTDFGDHDGLTYSEVVFREQIKVIRLPYVQVDSEEEDASVTDHRHISKHPAKPDKPIKPKSVLKKPTKSYTNISREKEETVSSPSSEASTSSSAIPPVTKSANSITSQEDVKREAVNTSAYEESINSTSVDIGSEKLHTSKRVRVSLPRHTDEGQDQTQSQEKGKGHVEGQNQGQKQRAKQFKPPECVTLSLRKERNRTREKTYMSEIGGSDVFSDDTCATRLNSDSVRLSIRSEDAISWAS